MSVWSETASKLRHALFQPYRALPWTDSLYSWTDEFSERISLARFERLSSSENLRSLLYCTRKRNCFSSSNGREYRSKSIYVFSRQWTVWKDFLCSKLRDGILGQVQSISDLGPLLRLNFCNYHRRPHQGWGQVSERMYKTCAGI